MTGPRLPKMAVAAGLFFSVLFPFTVQPQTAIFRNSRQRIAWNAGSRIDVACHPESYELSWRADGGSDWGLVLTSDLGHSQWLKFQKSELKDGFSTRAAVRISVAEGGPVLPQDKDFREIAWLTEGVDADGGCNVWKLAVSGRGMEISAGNRGVKPQASTAAGTSPLASLLFFSLKDDLPPVDFVTLKSNDRPSGRRIAPDLVDLKIANPSDSLEGEWGVFDRNLNESLLKMGGDYRVCLVRENDSYRIVYVRGATANKSRWQKGMTKGWLRPAGWPGIWNLVWLDSEGKTLSLDLKAQETEEGVLELQFPYQDSKVRLRRFKSR